MEDMIKVMILKVEVKVNNFLRTMQDEGFELVDVSKCYMKHNPGNYRATGEEDLAFFTFTKQDKCSKVIYKYFRMSNIDKGVQNMNSYIADMNKSGYSLYKILTNNSIRIGGTLIKTSLRGISVIIKKTAEQ